MSSLGDTFLICLRDHICCKLRESDIQSSRLQILGILAILKVPLASPKLFIFFVLFAFDGKIITQSLVSRTLYFMFLMKAVESEKHVAKSQRK